MGNYTDKTGKAKLFGSLFFVLLATFNLFMNVAHNVFSGFDLGLLLLTCLPLLLNRRLVYLIFGGLAAFLTIYIGFAFTVENVNTLNANKIGPAWGYVVGYSLISLSLFSAVLLVYAGISISDKRFSLI